MHHFWTQNDPFAPSKNFLGNIINTIFIYLLAPFIVQNFKKFLEWIQSYEDAPFLDPKWAHLPKQDFSENLLINLIPFIHAYLHSKNQSQISIY